MGRLAGDRAEATVTHDNLTSSNEKEGKKGKKRNRKRACVDAHLCLHTPSTSGYLRRRTLGQSGRGISGPAEGGQISCVSHFNHSLTAA